MEQGDYGRHEVLDRTALIMWVFGQMVTDNVNLQDDERILLRRSATNFLNYITLSARAILVDIARRFGKVKR